jgi:hypothetical protein
MGVVKVELPTGGEPVSSEVINEVSSALVAERQVTPHGRDIRWHAHLYPVFLAEQTIKNGFVSTEAIKVACSSANFTGSVTPEIWLTENPKSPGNLKSAK